MKTAEQLTVVPVDVRIFSRAPVRVSPLVIRALDHAVETELEAALRRTREQRRADLEALVASKTTARRA